MFSQQLRLSVAKPGLLILTPRGLSLTSFSESWAKYQHHLLFSPVNSAFSTHWFFFDGHTQGNSRSCRILLTCSEIQHLVSHWELKSSPASLHLVSQLLSFALSLTNLTFIFEIHRDCQDCCLSLFFWSRHTSLCIPGLNLPSLFYQPIAELFFSSLFMAAFILHQLSRSQSIVPTFTIHLFSFHNKLLQVPSHPAHHLLEEFFTQICAVPPYFFFKTLPCYKLVLNLMMLRSYCIPASQRCPKGHLAFSSQRLEFKYKLAGIAFLILSLFF